MPPFLFSVRFGFTCVLRLETRLRQIDLLLVTDNHIMMMCAGFIEFQDIISLMTLIYLSMSITLISTDEEAEVKLKMKKINL